MTFFKPAPQSARLSRFETLSSAPKADSRFNVSPLWEPADAITSFARSQVLFDQLTLDQFKNRDFIALVRPGMAFLTKGYQRVVRIVPRKMVDQIIKMMNLKISAAFAFLALGIIPAKNVSPARLPFRRPKQKPIRYRYIT